MTDDLDLAYRIASLGPRSRNQLADLIETIAKAEVDLAKRNFITQDKAHELTGIPMSALSGYVLLRLLDDGTLCGVLRLLYHYSVHVGIDYTGYRRRWCFGDNLGEPALALLAYDGGDDMPGPWRKDVARGLYRDPRTGKIWHESEPPPKGVGKNWREGI